jgi:hypothetical protein
MPRYGAGQICRATCRKCECVPMAAEGTTYDTGGDDLAEARGAQGVCATWWLPRLG